MPIPPQVKFGLALALAGALGLVPMAPVLAADEPPNIIENVHIVSSTIDVHTRLPTVVIGLDCLLDAGFLRIRVTLTQKVAGSISSSQQTSGGSCVVGTQPEFAVAFGPQQGTFKPGLADLAGFAAANDFTGFGDDVHSIQAPGIHMAPH